jgi:hypothetical protein
MSTRTRRNFTANWIGRCPVKSCPCVLHFDVPMIEETWTETLWNHACGYSWEQRKSTQFPVWGKYFGMYSLGLHCSTHKRELRWR